MATYDQTGGTLNLSVRKGQALAVTPTFGIDITGYTLQASVLSVVNGATILVPTATILVASAGTVSLSIPTTTLASGTYEWRLNWTSGGVQSEELRGFFEVIA